MLRSSGTAGCNAQIYTAATRYTSIFLFTTRTASNRSNWHELAFLLLHLSPHRPSMPRRKRQGTFCCPETGPGTDHGTRAESCCSNPHPPSFEHLDPLPETHGACSLLTAAVASDTSRAVTCVHVVFVFEEFPRLSAANLRVSCS